MGQTRNACRIVLRKYFSKNVYITKKEESDEWFNVRQIPKDRLMEISLISFMIMSFAAYATRIPWPTLVHSASIRRVEICDYTLRFPCNGFIYLHAMCFTEPILVASF
jgi:hypothetical protein